MSSFEAIIAIFHHTTIHSKILRIFNQVATSKDKQAQHVFKNQQLRSYKKQTQEIPRQVYINNQQHQQHLHQFLNNALATNFCKRQIKLNSIVT